MLKKEVLRGSKNFSVVYKKGKSIGSKYVVIFYKKNNLDYNRIAFVASKKVGNAVERNRARRLMKEGFRQISHHNLKNGFDIIFIARNTIIGNVKCEEVKKSINSAINRIKLK